MEPEKKKKLFKEAVPDNLFLTKRKKEEAEFIEPQDIYYWERPER